jgi:phosphatidylglycerol---prolipoprotein diacylglyceryl transferase
MALAAIPYHTFPDLVSIGGFQLRTFGLMVGLGILTAAWFAGSHGERIGVPREETYQLATRLVIAGVIGSRPAWDLANWDQIETPLDLIAMWEGGLQFTGGFALATLVAIPTVRKWPRLRKWRMADIVAPSLVLGMAFGRIGCTAVGEHFGSTWGASWFPLMVRYEGGEVREASLGNQPLLEGTVFHNTAIYEGLIMFLLFVVLWRLLERRPPMVPGTNIAIFAIAYSLQRFGLDFLRVNDELVAGLTGAQWACIATFAIGVWILVYWRPRNARLVEAETEELRELRAAEIDALGSETATEA